MPNLLPTYLRVLRLQSGLTQRELAGLLGIGESALCKFETLVHQPTKHLIVGAEVIFGQSARTVFPALYAQIERAVMRRASALSEHLDEGADDATKLKRRLLSQMIERSEVDNKHL